MNLNDFGRLQGRYIDKPLVAALHYIKKKKEEQRTQRRVVLPVDLSSG